MRSFRIRVLVLAAVAALFLSIVDIPFAASAETPSQAVDPREVPLLPSAAPTPEKKAPADPHADFSPLEARDASHFDADKSEAVSRSTFATEFENPDGTHTVRQSSEPSAALNRGR